MAFPTAVNGQVTDAVTQSNVKVIGEAPAQALSSVHQSLAHSTAIAMENAVTQEQQGTALANAAVTQCVSNLQPAKD